MQLHRLWDASRGHILIHARCKHSSSLILHSGMSIRVGGLSPSALGGVAYALRFALRSSCYLLSQRAANLNFKPFTGSVVCACTLQHALHISCRKTNVGGQFVKAVLPFALPLPGVLYAFLRFLKCVLMGSIVARVEVLEFTPSFQSILAQGG